MDTIEKAAAKLAKSGSRSVLPMEQPHQSSDLVESTPSSHDSQSIRKDEVLPLRERLKTGGFLSFQGDNAQQIEEYRRIKRPLLMNMDSQGETRKKASNLIMVTSSMPGEGKTFTSINLAVSIAMELDRTVLFIDADVHKPAASAQLGIEQYPGLTDVLGSKTLSVADVLIKTDVPKITLLSVGCDRNNANELLASSNMQALMNELAQRYHDRVIIIDTPPILVTNEASILVNLVGQVVVVVEAEKTQQSVLEEALSSIDIENINIGLVLNKGRISSGKSGYYYGEYGYPGE